MKTNRTCYLPFVFATTLCVAWSLGIVNHGGAEECPNTKVKNIVCCVATPQSNCFDLPVLDCRSLIEALPAGPYSCEYVANSGTKCTLVLDEQGNPDTVLCGFFHECHRPAGFCRLKAITQMKSQHYTDPNCVAPPGGD